MRRLTSSRSGGAAAPPASTAPPRSSWRCSWCRSSASPPSRSTSVTSTPSAPGCRPPPTPPRSPSPRTAPAAPAGTCGQPPRRWSRPTSPARRRGAGAGERADARHGHRGQTHRCTGSPRCSASTRRTCAPPPRSPGASPAAAPPSCRSTFSWCEWQAQTGGRHAVGHHAGIIVLPKNSDTELHRAVAQRRPRRLRLHGHRPGELPGDERDRSARRRSDPGNIRPRAAPGDFSALARPDRAAAALRRLGRDRQPTPGTRSTATPPSSSTGYYFAGQNRLEPAPCSGSARCIAGYFTRYVDLSDRFTWTTTGPDLGADILKLIR